MVMPKQPEDSELTAAVLEVARVIRRHTNHLDDWGNWLRSQLGLVTKKDLSEMESRVMSAISDFGAVVDTAFASISASVDGIAADVAFLKAKIEELQNNPGPISPADQAVLDAIQAKAAELTTKVQVLDAATEQPPTPPPPA